MDCHDVNKLNILSMTGFFALSMKGGLMHHGSGAWSGAEGFASLNILERWKRTLLHTSLWFTRRGVLIRAAYKQVY